MAVSRPTPSSMGQQVHDLDIRVSLMEDRYKRIDDKLDRVLEGLSASGHPPTPKGKGKPKDDDPSSEDAKPRGWGLREGTGREMALIATAVITVISSTLGAIQTFRNGSNASNAAYDGAQQAIEQAVEQAEAVPVAPPPIVVPVPKPFPVPIPAPPASGSEAAVVPDDLLPQAGE